MSDNTTEIELNLINDKVKFLGKSGKNHDIIIDYAPPFGDGEGYTSLELLLVSLASCLSTTLLALIRNELKKNVISLKVSGYGKRRTEHPKNFLEINLKYDIVSNDLSESDFRNMAALAESKYCPVWTMLDKNVKVNIETSIKKE